MTKNPYWEAQAEAKGLSYAQYTAELGEEGEGEQQETLQTKGQRQSFWDIGGTAGIYNNPLNGGRIEDNSGLTSALESMSHNVEGKSCVRCGKPARNWSDYCGSFCQTQALSDGLASAKTSGDTDNLGSGVIARPRERAIDRTRMGDVLTIETFAKQYPSFDSLKYNQ